MLQCKSCDKNFVNEEDYLKNSSSWILDDDDVLRFKCGCGADLKLEPGSHNWYSADISMSAKASSVFNTLSLKGKLPHIPASVMELQILLADPESDTKDLAKSVKADPVIGAELLVQAENRGAASGNKIQSFEHAISFLGRETLNEMCLVAAIKSFNFQTAKFDHALYWNQMKLTGILAENIAIKFIKHVEPDQAYLAGSLCNIGKAIAAICYPEKTDEIQSTMDNPKLGRPWIDIEEELDTPSHTVLGEIAATLWGLPEFVKKTASGHHELDSSDTNLMTIVDVASLANQLMHWITGRPELMDNSLMEGLLAKANIDDGFITQFVEETKPSIPEEYLI